MRLNSEVSTSLHVLHLRYHYDTTLLFFCFLYVCLNGMYGTNSSYFSSRDFIASKLAENNLKGQWVMNWKEAATCCSKRNSVIGIGRRKKYNLRNTGHVKLPLR